MVTGRICIIEQAVRSLTTVIEIIECRALGGYLSTETRVSRGYFRIVSRYGRFCIGINTGIAGNLSRGINYCGG